MAERVVGTAYVRLRLLTDSISKDIKKSIESSDLQDVNIKVDADTADAAAQLEEIKLQANRLEKESPTIRPQVDTKDARKQTNLLKDALILLGPTIGPLGGAVTAAMAGVAAGAGVAVLAVLGVKKEMKDATTVGVQFSAGLQTLKRDLSTLEQTAARGALSGFRTAVDALHQSLPDVNRSVGSLSRTFGDMTGHLVGGLVNGLRTFDPLLQHIALSADIAAQHFEKWSTGPGGAHFAQTIGKEFDQVIPVLINLTQAVAKLVTAFLPIGGSILGVLNTLANVINAIPLGVLKDLATVFVTLYAAKRLTGVFASIGSSLTNLGAGAGAAKIGISGMATGLGAFVSKAAPAVGIAIALLPVAKQIGNALGDIASMGHVAGDSLNAVWKNSATAYASFYNSVVQAKGAVDDSVRSSIVYQLQQDGFVDKAAKAGIAQDALTNAVTGTQEQFDRLIDSWRAGGKPSGDTEKALIQLRDAFMEAKVNAQDYVVEQKIISEMPTWKSLNTTADSITQVALKFDTTADAVKNYAALLGISDTAIKNGTITNLQLANAVKTVQGAYNTATASGATFLAALQQFSTSPGAALDRAQLIGSFLKAAQGDALGYAGAVSSAYAANQNLITGFNNQGDKIAKLRDQLRKGTLDSTHLGLAQRSLQRQLAGTEFAAINLRTGMIDVSKAGAGPLIQSLQGMQDAAMAAATATYQHEVRLRGAGRAAADAATIFRTQTYDALVRDAAQLGLTSAQAKRLANQYFALPKDVATKVRAIGTDPVVTVLNKIGRLLANLTGQRWETTVTANTGPAKRALADLQARIVQMEHPVITPVIGKTAGGSVYGGHLKQYASGGGVQDGFFTVGERGWEAGYKKGSQVQIFPHSVSQRMLGASRVPGYANGTSAATQYRNLSASLTTLRIKIDDTDLSRLQNVLSGSATSIRAVMQSLITDLDRAVSKAGSGSGIVAAVRMDNIQLLKLAGQRDSINRRMGAANQRLATLRDASKQEAANIAGAIRGDFDITTAGQYQAGSSGVTRSSAARIASDLAKQLADTRRFGSQLSLLAKRGLNKDLLRQLAESGVDRAGVNVNALASASTAQLRSINASYRGISSTAGGIGQNVASSLYHAQIVSAQHVVSTLERQRHDANTQMTRLFAHINALSRALANRPVHLVVNGRELARAVNNQNLVNARYSR